MKKVIFGSPTDDYAYSMQENFAGLFILAKMGNHFNPHMNNDKEWSMRNNGETTIGLIRMNFQDEIVNVEGHPLSSQPDPHPTYALVAPKDPITSMYMDFVFIAHRSNEVTDYQGGIFLTKMADETAAYTTSTACFDVNCKFCDSKQNTYCHECAAGYFVHNF